MAGSKDSKKGKVADQSSKLDAIKDIIFGQQIQEYEHQFDAIRQSVEQVQQEGDKSRETMHKELISRLDRMQEDINKQMADNQERLMQEIRRLNDQKTDRKALGKMLENIGGKLSS